jgi:hypothetical protein
MKLPALKGGAFRKGKYLFQIASLKEKAGLAGKPTGQIRSETALALFNSRGLEETIIDIWNAIA